jgi:hypothetical protein
MQVLEQISRSAVAELLILHSMMARKDNTERSNNKHTLDRHIDRQTDSPRSIENCTVNQ